MLNVAIFEVFVWHIDDYDNKYHPSLHMVVGTDSADAERRFKESHPDHVNDHTFISTDNRVALRTSPYVHLYTSNLIKTPLTEQNLALWVEQATVPAKMDDGRTILPFARKI